MAADIGVKIGIEGAAQFKQSLATVNSELKSLSAEMKAATAEFKGNENSSEALAKKADILGRSMDAAKEKIAILSSEYEKQQSRLAELGEALQRAREEYGENSTEAERAERAFSQQEQTVNKLGAQLHNAEADLHNMRNAEDELGKETEETTDKASTFGEMLKAKLTGDLIVGGVKAIAGAVVDLGKKMLSVATGTASYADNVNTLATQYNLTTDQVQEFMYMEDLADVSMETIAGSLTKLTKNMGAAQTGTGAASDAFKKLGVEVTNSDGTMRNANDVFMDTIDALGNVENATERDTIAMALFGKGAQDLNPLIALGADGFADLAAEAHEAGAVMGGDALTAANKFQDQMDRMKQKTDGLKREIGMALLPVLSNLIDKATEWAEKIDWQKVGAVITGVFRNIGAAIRTVASFLSTVISLAKQAYEAMKNIKLNYKGNGDNAMQGLVGAGLYAEGYYDVPYDRFPALLHKDEMVLTASEARALRAGGMGGASVNIYTQQLDNATVDYVISRVNVALGGAV